MYSYITVLWFHEENDPSTYNPRNGISSIEKIKFIIGRLQNFYIAT